MNDKDFIKGFMTAALLLPERLSRAAFSLPEADRPLCEELRLRLQRPMAARVGGRLVELRLGGAPVLATQEELEGLLARATGSSVHSYGGQIARGYITAQNGHRLGLCGEITAEGGRTATLRSISSINLRIAKQAVGLADGLCQSLYAGGFGGTLIVAPPGAGKTTLLRDMARWLSGGRTVALVDERHEVAGVRQGVPSFELGGCDILTGCGKAEGIDLLLRSMGPQVIALDEITSRRDVWAIAQAAYCGCGFLATAHGGSVGDLVRRPVYRALMEQDIFENIIFIENCAGARRYRIFRRGEEEGAQAAGAGDDCGVVLGHGVFYERQPEGAGRIAAQLYGGLSDYQGRDRLSSAAAARHPGPA